GDYLRANIDSLSSDKPIRFESELDHINHYVTLEKASTDVDFTMIYELNIRNFNIPPLTIQPIVENAIKHGALTRRDGSGVVKIRTEEKDGNIIITVTDNGAGKMPL
ncbi:MAG: sensor histidine kinase, partial [Ruminococcus sp.]|nr:sensor histidine kinase [Ruminococcus sp.]